MFVSVQCREYSYKKIRYYVICKHVLQCSNQNDKVSLSEFNNLSFFCVMIQFQSRIMDMSEKK